MHLKTRAPYPGWRGGLYRWFGLIALVLLFAQQAGAQNGLFTIGHKNSYVLSRPFTYPEESSAALTLDDVLRPGLQARFLLFFSVQDRAYPIYVFFCRLACVGLSEAANSGLAAQFLWPDALWWNDNSLNAAYSAGGTFGVQFARSLLATRLKMPALDRWMLALTGLWIGAVFAALFFALRSRVVARNSAGTADRGDGCMCRGRQHPAPPPRRGIVCACLGRIVVRCRHPGPAQKCWGGARKRSLLTVCTMRNCRAITSAICRPTRSNTLTTVARWG